jgi:glycosyltransferase involved in cell wall biosynthesis
MSLPAIGGSSCASKGKGENPALTRKQLSPRRSASGNTETSVAGGVPAAPEDAQEPASAEPLVTALIVTYNHRNYFPAAVESALAQRTTFPVEILISEDASTDGTRDIVEGWAARHPGRVRLLLSEHNLRSNEVVARGLRTARGRYVALLDGDDYWTDPGKLQRQVDFLEVNPGCAAVFHNARTSVGDRLTDDRWTRGDTGPRLGLAAIMEGNPFATCAGMMRTDCVRDVPDWYAGFFPITDWPLYALCAIRGELAFLDEVSGVYRLHDGGAFSGRSVKAKLDTVEAFYRRLASVAPPPLDRAARGGCSRYFFEWARACLASGDLALARSCFRRSLRGGGVGRTVPRRDALRLGLRLLDRSVRHR